ncbi:hypothetical protein C2G38_2308393 [Gigaspora rosea]|uniref:Trypsin-like cysteine/serine peptidase domain-containing protein n=1 Tax=Gigaspora rosea TaxID=44941 RepID=A0A397WAG5_9GLOM|nr:hypothetical protein C2G38_2308393 [Gigaspora rosea]
MRKFYILSIILFIFTLPKYLIVHSQEGSKEPLAKLWNIDNEDIPKYLDFIAAANSTAKLNYKFEEITKLAKSFKLNTTSVGYIDARINDIVINTCNQTRFEENNVNFMNAIKIHNPMIFYYDCKDSTDDNFSTPNNMEFGKRNNIVKKILAGDGLYKIGTRNGTCTAGFVATTKENIICIATAGHCYLNDAEYYLRPWNSEPTTYLIGKMNFAYLDKIDFGLIPIVGDVKPEPSIRNTDSEKYRELLIDDDIAVSHYGVHLCVSGYYSHVKCGYVISLNGFASFQKHFQENLFIVNLAVINGDSGSPLFSYKQDLMRVSLSGILLGGANTDEVYGNIATVITISSILNTLRKDGREISVVTAN